MRNRNQRDWQRRLRLESLESRRVLATWTVDPDSGGACTLDDPICESIQEAVDAADANPGPDTVRILPGTYPGGVEIEVSDNGGEEVGAVAPNDLTVRGVGDGVILDGGLDEGGEEESGGEDEGG